MSDCQNFPGLGTRQTDTQTDTQPIPRIWLSDPREFPGYTNTHSKPSREENEVVRKFHAQAKGIEPLRPDIWYKILGYLLYQRVQDVLHDANHCEKSSSKLFEERCSIFAAKKVTNQPKPEGFFTQTNRRKITAKNPNWNPELGPQLELQTLPHFTAV